MHSPTVATRMCGGALLAHCLVVAAALQLQLAAAANVADKPDTNFIFVLADDWGYGDTSPYNTLLQKGLDKPATPRLHKMASEGTTFTNFHTLGAECSPSRASWMTGRSPSDKLVKIHLVIGNHATNVGKGCADFIPPSTPSITATMQAAGYFTGHFGKWHMGSSQAYNSSDGVLMPAAPTPKNYGLDVSKCYACNPDGPNATYDTKDEWFPSNSSRLIVDDGLAAIARAAQVHKAFYLNIHFHISHAPMYPTEAQLQALADWESPPAALQCGAKLKQDCAFPFESDDDCLACTRAHDEPYCNPAQRNAYCSGNGSSASGVVPAHLCGENTNGPYATCPRLVYRASQFEADAQIGRLLDNLDRLNLSQSTLVIFSGDNGPEDPHIYMNSVGDPGPFRGRKRSLYDGGVRLPLIARWVGHVPAGRVSRVEIMSADWLPTVASLGGAALLPAPGGSPLMGMDMSAAFVPGIAAPPGTGGTGRRQTPIMWDYRADGYGVCWNQAPRLAILQDGLKLHMNADRTRFELFNVTANTFEADNVAHELPAQAQRMAALLEAWVATLDPIKPGTMGASATHAGCAAYAFPSGGPDGAAAVSAAQLLADAEHDPYLV